MIPKRVPTNQDHLPTEDLPQADGIGHGSTGRRRTWVWLLAWAVLVGGVFVWGYLLRRSGHEDQDALPPLYATPRLLIWQLLPAVAFAGLCVAALPKVAQTMRWRLLLPLSWLLSAGWAVALAISDGVAALARPLTSQNEYLAGLAAVRRDPIEWVRTFTERLQSYPVHTKGHPPLPMLFLWALDAMGLRGAGWAATAIILIGASAAPAIGITLRLLAGDSVARRALPFLVLAPVALWIATSMDAMFLGVAAWSTALLAFATTSAGGRAQKRTNQRTKRIAIGAALGGGVLMGALPYLSYGLVPLLAVPLATFFLVRPRRTILIATACGYLLIPLLFTLGGFWWADGVVATQQAYESVGGSSRRPYGYFLIADLGVLAILTGPAVTAALALALARFPKSPARQRTHEPLARTTPETTGEKAGAVRSGGGLGWRGAGVLGGAAFLGVLALDFSGVTRGEVERIWVPYAAWMVAVAGLHGTPARRWLALQAATAIVVQALVLSAW